MHLLVVVVVVQFGVAPVVGVVILFVVRVLSCVFCITFWRSEFALSGWSFSLIFPGILVR